MVRLAVAASMSMFAVLGGGRAQPQSDLDEILRKTAAFIAAFERESPAVVSEEAYRQIATFRGVDTIRTLRSDVLVIGDPDAGWVGFRDVFEVDGRPVRDRDERLMTLFQNPTPTSGASRSTRVKKSRRRELRHTPR